jgi:Zn-dependent protease with chaperone function
MTRHHPSDPHGAVATPLAQPPADRAVGPDPGRDRSRSRETVVWEGGLWLALFAVAGALLLEPVAVSALSLRLYRVRALHPQEAPEIWAMLRELSARAGLSATPVPHYVPSGIVNVNAFATGSRRLASIALTDGLPGWGNPEPSWLRTHTAAEDRIARLMELAPQPSQTLPFQTDYLVPRSFAPMCPPRRGLSGLWR